MTASGRRAAEELLTAGVEIVQADEASESAIQFYLPHASYNGDQKYADFRGRWIRETWVNDQTINGSSIRHDIYEVLVEHDLWADWEDGGTMVITHDQQEDSQGFRFTLRNSQTAIDNIRRMWAKSGGVPSMSPAAFDAFRDLARLGAPVWDYHNMVPEVYDPAELAPSVQFVMTCEPEYDRVFAQTPDHSEYAFPDTNGLRSDVYQVVEKHGLATGSHTHHYDHPHGRPLHLVTFSDPKSAGRS